MSWSSGEGEGEVKPSRSKKFRNDYTFFGTYLSSSSGDENDERKDTPESLEDVIRRKVICLPEMMEKILGYLDLRSLKQVRLTSKRWLLEAQAHMERRGIVSLKTPSALQGFLFTCQRKIQALPIPFQALDVAVSYLYPREGYSGVVNELLSLPPPLTITRLDTWVIPPNLAITLITKFSSSLGHLHLYASDSWEETPPLDDNQEFPKLRQLCAETMDDVVPNVMAHFPSLLAWLVNGSPNLETYEFNEMGDDQTEFISAVVMQVDIRNVKGLRFVCHSNINNAAASHFCSIPFGRLEALSLDLPLPLIEQQVFMAVVAKSFLTLKELDFPGRRLGDEVQARFPQCPNVEQLALHWVPYLKSFVPTRFPSLHTLTIMCNSGDTGDWSDMTTTPPFCGLKRLRIHGYATFQPDQNVIKVFEKFPALEVLAIDDSDVLFGVSPVSTSLGLPNSLNLLKGIKHLVVDTNIRWSCIDYAGWYCLLSVLTGLESLRMERIPTDLITSVPVKELPQLKVIQFSWHEDLDLRKLLGMTQGVEKVLVSNCCSVLENEDYSWFSPRGALETFFENAPNAGCGCELSLWRRKWFPENIFSSARDNFL